MVFDQKCNLLEQVGTSVVPRGTMVPIGTTWYLVALVLMVPVW